MAFKMKGMPGIAGVKAEEDLKKELSSGGEENTHAQDLEHFTKQLEIAKANSKTKAIAAFEQDIAHVKSLIAKRNNMAFKMKGSPMARNYGAPFMKPAGEDHEKEKHTHPHGDEQEESKADPTIRRKKQAEENYESLTSKTRGWYLKHYPELSVKQIDAKIALHKAGQQRLKMKPEHFSGEVDPSVVD
mgnify:CR=1 FL=1